MTGRRATTAGLRENGAGRPARRTSAFLALLSALALAAAACGSTLTRQELEAANGSLTVEAPAGSVSAEGRVAAGDASVQPADPTPSASPSASAPGAGPRAQATPGPATPAAGATRRPAGPVAPGAAARPASAARAQAASPGPPRKSEIVLGSFGVASGLLGAVTAPIPVADKAWAADVNARGGLNGHPVRIIFADDGGDPARALEIVRRMVEKDGVLGFMGTYAITTMQAVTPYLEQHGVPVIGALSGNEIEDASPMIFSPQAGATLGTAWSVPLAITSQTDKRKIAVLYCAEASTCANLNRLLRQIAPQAGLETTYEAQVSAAQPDFTAELLAARRSGAEVVVGLIDTPSIIRMARAAKRQGWSPVFAGTHNLNDDQMKAGGKDVEGLLASANVASYWTSPLLKPYRDAVARHVPGGGLSGLGAAAWVQGKLWERIAPFLGDQPTRQQVLEGLYSLRNETLGGLVPPLTFNRGPHANVNLCVVPIKFSGATFVPLNGNSEGFVCPPGWKPGG